MAFKFRSLLTFVALSISLSGASARIYERAGEVPDLNDYDYVVIGGGVTGAVVANRLTEDANTRVLILESGVSHQGVQAIQVPGLQSGTAAGTLYNWNYTSIPQANCNDREIGVPRGHVLGGSSSVHGMWYTRGSSADYDRWAEVIGDDGWAWDNLQHYFIKSEQMVAPADGRDTTGMWTPSLHGTDGPLAVTVPGFTDVVDQYIIDRMDDEFPFIEDHGSGQPLGFGWIQVTMNAGERSSAATAYLDPFLNRPNLDVLLNARATRITGSGDVIDTVEFQQYAQGEVLTAQPRAEIILAAGSINTPHLLLNSGIGDESVLSSLNIPTVVNLPDVGKNMSEHPAILNMFNTAESIHALDPDADFDAALVEWEESRTGRMTMGVANTVGWHRLNMSNPEVQDFFDRYGDPAPGPESPHIELLPTVSAFGARENYANAGFLIDSVVLVPQSRGSVSLDPEDPTGYPLIDYGFYSDERDIILMREAIKTALRFLDHPVWDGFLAEPATPGLAEIITALQNDDENLYDIMDAYIRENTVLAFHVVGSCSMSSADADWGVVNPDFRVKGVNGVRVVDASIMPYVPAAHPQAVVYAIAERAADAIKGLI